MFSKININILKYYLFVCIMHNIGIVDIDFIKNFNLKQLKIIMSFNLENNNKTTIIIEILYINIFVISSASSDYFYSLTSLNVNKQINRLILCL